MNFVYADITQKSNFYRQTNPIALIAKYGSPLYVYNETILRQRCREMKNLITYPRFQVNYSMKANGNLTLLKIAREEGLRVDTMSPGEIYVALHAGFTPEQILYIGNNVSAEEMRYAIDRKILVSVDSLAQLELYGKLNPGGAVLVRFNPGIGAGHHKKVVTGGKKTKFAVEPKYIPEVKTLLQQYRLRLIGVNQHIGSLFMEGVPYIEAAKSLLQIASQFENLEFIDFGGGFGIPYHKQEGQKRLDLAELGHLLDETIRAWVKAYGKEVTFLIEPGRYIPTECSVLLGSVYAVKINYDIKYVGTDLGFNVLVRPVMYDSHHDIEIYRNDNRPSTKTEEVTIVGNICETGDMIAKNRRLPEIFEGDVLGVLDAGAYGFSMSSNYNNRLRPAEVLITENGGDVLIRRRDTLEDLMRNHV
jgi:diaminopimelate decarboxylase